MPKTPDTDLPGARPGTRSGGIEGEGSDTATGEQQESVDGFMERRTGQHDAERAHEGESLRDTETAVRERPKH